MGYRVNRRSFIKGAAGILVPAVVLGDIEPVRRFWQLDRTMASGFIYDEAAFIPQIGIDSFRAAITIHRGYGVSVENWIAFVNTETGVRAYASPDFGVDASDQNQVNVAFWEAATSPPVASTAGNDDDDPPHGIAINYLTRIAANGVGGSVERWPLSEDQGSLSNPEPPLPFELPTARTRLL
jgi:hypothetical protein